jgi:hypothetical protein
MAKKEKNVIHAHILASQKELKGIAHFINYPTKVTNFPFLS